MKTWKNVALELMKDEQAREDYHSNSHDLENNPLYIKKKKQYSKYYSLLFKQYGYLSNFYVPLEFDKPTMDFLIDTPRWNTVTNAMNWVMSWVYTKTDIMGYLDMGKMFILSTNQYRKLLFNQNNSNSNNSSNSSNVILKSLLDVGSGCGTTTLQLAPLFENILATEASRGMVYSLKRKGINSIYCTDLKESIEIKDKQFTVVSCLNVLDRCEKPLTLLKDMKNFIEPNGKLILAVVYPFNPYVEFGGIENEPLEDLNINNKTCEEFINSFYQIFQSIGYHLNCFTKAPYISEGDGTYQNYVLTDIVFILTPIDTQSVDNNSNTTTSSNNNSNNNDNLSQQDWDLMQHNNKSFVK
ncbi:hypothetical protein CYY_002089 [Polysphondylium violaceum]|uniref:DREV methyltransferase n=1 Tax=Polysphondylium violaceum TaxID=133409 RepID=A0A8J4V381_9MYCE|nr:hypothetical protein CYY_002089 [Polysphondylium violaceum]